MSTDMPPLSTEKGNASQLPRPQRVLACLLCQQRKVKCDRKYPCFNCIKSRAQCVPATQLSRQRKRRFPERELLERLRKYEDLLRQNNIKFEPLHNEATSGKFSSKLERPYDSDEEPPKITRASPSSDANSDRVYDSKNILDVMRQEFRDPDKDSDSSDDDVNAGEFKDAWDQAAPYTDQLLFGSRNTAVDISTLHPEPVHIFRLWQLYLENVDPLLKVTHTPSLQGQVIEAATDLSNIRPTLEALMFGIYCMSILSLEVVDCHAIFGSPKADLLTRYQFGCQQALLNCKFLGCNERDCLTALLFYMMSVRSSTTPQALSSLLGVAIRTAQRMGLDNESALIKCTPLEAELRRRLWWSLVLFDTRISELADSKTSTLTPTWNCRIPLNANDSDFRQEMKEHPQDLESCTEALFVIVRSELGNFIRHARYHLDLTSPALISLVKDVHPSPVIGGSEVDGLESMIESKYLSFCDPENPLHFMTIWTARAFIAKCRLAEQLSKVPSASTPQADVQPDFTVSCALSMLECDTKLLNSPLTNRFIWMFYLYFPFTAYIQISQKLKRRPISSQAEHAWEVMSDNYEARFSFLRQEGIPMMAPFFKIFARFVLQAWEAREASSRHTGELLTAPRIVVSIRHSMAQIAQKTESFATGPPDTGAMVGVDGFPMPTAMDFDNHGLSFCFGEDSNYPAGELGAYSNISMTAPLDFDLDQLDWSAMDWSLGNTPGSGSTGLPLPR
ncbi:Aurofusarin cluster transcription factor aurR2 [Lachnellula suecica]|uniref:Aurofusarin cluster transcription factor aurR2 n=1 Tax=Lachnellula suecica TaxID=602035 RepID=A0A8T9CH86_9HELO|nr:Aurofusarin cluster transcription factor aurR2 [Lachnellula suecica]